MKYSFYRERRKEISVRQAVSKTRQKVLAFVVMNNQGPLKSLVSEGPCVFVDKKDVTAILAIYPL